MPDRTITHEPNAIQSTHLFCSRCGADMRYALDQPRMEGTEWKQRASWECSKAGVFHDYFPLGHEAVTPNYDVMTGRPLVENTD